MFSLGDTEWEKVIGDGISRLVGEKCHIGRIRRSVGIFCVELTPVHLEGGSHVEPACRQYGSQ